MDIFKYSVATIFISLMLSGFKFSSQSDKNLHPFFVSVTEITQNNAGKNLEVSCKIFTDDFEKTLRQNYNTHVDLLNPVDKRKMEDLIFDYIKKHLQIIVNDKLLTLRFVGYEKDEEAIWAYCEVNETDTIKTIEVNDNLLYEYKKEQINLLHVIVNGIRKSTKLNNPEAQASFKF